MDVGLGNNPSKIQPQNMSQELIDHIFEYIPATDIRILNRLSCVCRSWCSASRRLSWHRTVSHARKTETFLHLLTSPLQTIAAHVRELYVFDNHLNYRIRVSLSTSLLLNILALLPAMHTLTLSALDLNSGNQVGGDRARYSLRTLDLSRVRFILHDGFTDSTTNGQPPEGIPDILLSFAEIDSLILSVMHFSRDWEERLKALQSIQGSPNSYAVSPQLSSIRLHVRHLTLSDDIPQVAVPILQNLLDMPGLRTLRLNKCYRSGIIPGLVTAFGRNVDHMTIRKKYQFSQDDLLDFSKCAFTVLKLKVSSREPLDDHAKLLHLIHALTHAPPTLSSLRIGFDVFISGRDLDNFSGLDPVTVQRLGVIDELIATRQGLNDVVLTLDIRSDSEENRPSDISPERDVLRHFPRLGTRGAVHIKYPPFVYEGEELSSDGESLLS